MFGAIIKKLKFLWNLGYQHGDIKGANIVLADNGEPFLIDFNLSQKTTDWLICGGTPGYMSSGKRNCERRLPVEYDDMFSLAITMGTVLARDGEPEVNAAAGNCVNKWESGCARLYRKKLQSLLVENNFCPTTSKTSLFSMTAGATICDAVTFWVRDEDMATLFSFEDILQTFRIWLDDYAKIDLESQPKASFMAGNVDLSKLDVHRRKLYELTPNRRILGGVKSQKKDRGQLRRAEQKFNDFDSGSGGRTLVDQELPLNSGAENPFKRVI